MNGIEFKAKSLRTGEWIIGKNIAFLYPNGSDELICTMINSDEPYTVDENGYMKYKPDIVDIETVGQYCGKRDRDGFKIYKKIGDNIKMNKIKWYFKQLLPLKWETNYWENGKHYHCNWRMFFGRCFNIKTREII